ncbi:SRPBCC family protein [Rhizobiaceae bacterium n13]|uniref:SRPBCC family protein n=1 Tax=Ferirhizobium litorale TaxID=2927786 RepID=A0AAE3QCT8_9HYPH|nr:SRPBCC family protein [Fererhizobium litorale]MDI7860885.1 SRPBCC family protein [Fererhizobium litorale]MDI7921033.1 SRPBCC family protein [Fererhizobium litorale]
MTLVEPIPAGDFAVATTKDSVRIERLLPGPIERVWSYLTEQEKRRRWMAAGVVEMQEGGVVCHVFDNSRLTSRDDHPPAKYAALDGPVKSHGIVTACEAPRLLAYTFSEESGEPSEVRFDLSESGSQVLLVVTHTRIPNRAAMLSFTAGWHTHLDILRDRLEGREPELFWPKHTRLEEEYGSRIPII